MVWLALVALIIAGFCVPRLGKALLMLAAIVVLAGLGLWAYLDRQHDRHNLQPVKQTALYGIALGKTEDDVLLAKGKPTNRHDDADGLALAYQTSSSSPLALVWFDDDSKKVSKVCGFAASDDHKFDVTVRPDADMADYYVGADAKILDRLGPNFHSSVSDGRLTEARTWSDYNVAFEVEAGKISGVCVTNSPVRLRRSTNTPVRCATSVTV